VKPNEVHAVDNAERTRCQAAIRVETALYAANPFEPIRDRAGPARAKSS
jgi:hypothetical protein